MELKGLEIKVLKTNINKQLKNLNWGVGGKPKGLARNILIEAEKNLPEFYSHPSEKTKVLNEMILSSVKNANNPDYQNGLFKLVKESPLGALDEDKFLCAYTIIQYAHESVRLRLEPDYSPDIH